MFFFCLGKPTAIIKNMVSLTCNIKPFTSFHELQHNKLTKVLEHLTWYYTITVNNNKNQKNVQKDVIEIRFSIL